MEASSYATPGDAVLNRGRPRPRQLRAAFGRQRGAITAGLISGWTALVASLVWSSFIAVVALVGIVIRIVFGEGASAAHYISSTLVVFGGDALLALLGGLHAPLYLVLGAAIAAVITTATTILEPALLSLRGYRRMSRREAQRIGPLFDEVCAAMHLRRIRPAIWIAEKQLPGAWTETRTIVLHQAIGLHAGDRRLDDEQIRALLAHELHHWIRGDAVASRLAWACSLPVVLPYSVGIFIRDGYPGIIGLLGWVVLWPSWVLMHLVIGPLAAAASRRQEYEADAAAAAVGYRGGMRKLLEELRPFEPPRTTWEKVLSASHPPVELRLEALEDAPAPPRSGGQREGVVAPPAPAPARASRPAVAAYREPTASGRVLLAVALVVAAVLVVDAKPFRHSTGASSQPPVRAPGPTPVTPAGAQAIAVDADQAIVSSGFDLTRLHAVVAAFVAPQAQDRIYSVLDRGINGAEGQLAVQQPGRSFTEYGSVSSTRLVRFAPPDASFDVAAIVTFATQPQGPAIQNCDVTRYDLVRIRNAWKVSNFQALSTPAGDTPPACVPAGFRSVSPP